MIKDYGYDSLTALDTVLEEHIEEMINDPAVDMKKPHRHLFMDRWEKHALRRHVLSWYCLSVLPSMLRGDAKRSGAGTERRRGRGGDKTMTRNKEAFGLPSLLLKLEIQTVHRLAVSLHPLPWNSLGIGPEGSRRLQRGKVH